MDRKNLNVRAAEERDLPTLVPWGEKFYSKLEFPEEPSIDELLSNRIKNKACIVAEGDDGLMGFVPFCTYSPPYSHNIIIAQELAWWVVPECRGSGVGKLLLNEFTNQAKDRGAGYLAMAHLASNPSLGIFYIQQGFRCFETSYIKKI